MYGNQNPSIKKKIYIRSTYFMFYLVKVSPIARVTSLKRKPRDKKNGHVRSTFLCYVMYKHISTNMFAKKNP